MANNPYLNRAFALGALAAAAFGAPAAQADEVRQSRDLPEFTRLSLNGSMDAVVRLGDSQSVVIITEEDFQEKVKTEVRDGQLTIKQKGNRWYNEDVEVEIIVRSFEGLDINGSSDVFAEDIVTGSFSLDINGSGDVELSGSCTDAQMEINGSGDIDAKAFECDAVQLSIHGSGDATIYSSNDVNVTIAGSGDVDIYGGGRIGRSRIAGSGELRTH